MARRDEKVSRDLGARLRELRRERGWTQETLAERIGIEVGNYAHVEQGISNPTVSTLARFASALDVPVHELLFAPRDRTVTKGRPPKATSRRAEVRALVAVVADERAPIDVRIDAARKTAVLLKRVVAERSAKK